MKKFLIWSYLICGLANLAGIGYSTVVCTKTFWEPLVVMIQGVLLVSALLLLCTPLQRVRAADFFFVRHLSVTLALVHAVFFLRALNILCTPGIDWFIASVTFFSACSAALLAAVWCLRQKTFVYIETDTRHPAPIH